MMPNAVASAVAARPGPLPPYQALKPIASAARATSVAPLPKAPRAWWAATLAATATPAAVKRRMAGLDVLVAIAGGYPTATRLSSRIPTLAWRQAARRPGRTGAHRPSAAPAVRCRQGRPT